MAAARGTLLLSTIRFVKTQYGPTAHERVVEALADPHRSFVTSEIREAAWAPLEDLAAYMETAQRILDPGDPDFHRRIGFQAGQENRASPMGIMVEGMDRAMAMNRILWRYFFDVGDAEVVERTKCGATLRIRDFPTRASLCQRIRGSLEGLLSGGPPITVTHAACVLEGDPTCDMRVTWQPRDQPLSRA